ncbi:ABC transporter permease [Ornithinibacillus halotolerans]|uniref:Uncharacterized protein n=1 Tax=Ornithinibacillus halotolerans TaxID=1274357 RepID=A0A916WE41_9BACI|nr:ABC transporter permease subunit [Ornithinibacillus halotolerans]GGA89812.1 hypothetical protein GCM10008025_35540 [Ornithinibacillus halotolerans]
MKQLLFEMKKLTRTRTFFVFLLLTVLFIGGMFVKNVVQQDKIITQKVEHFSKYLRDVSQEIEGDREQLKKADDPELEAKVEVGVELYRQLSELIHFIRNNNWKAELEAEIAVYNVGMRYKEMKGSFNMGISDMQDTIKLNERLLALELPKENMDLSIQTSIFMKKTITTILNTFGFLFILLVLGTVITKEFEDKNMQLVYTLPISRSSYIIVKFISLLFSGIVWLATVFLISYILPTLFGKNKGDIFTYPLFTDQEMFISTDIYIKESILYSLSFMIFSIALVVFWGFLLRSTILTYLVVLLLFISSFILITNGFTLFENPFTYQSIDLVILKEQLYFPTGIIVPFLSAVLLIVITMAINKRRGI